MTKKEMLAFNDDCDEAARQCPQFRGWGANDRTILLGEITPKELVKRWSECDTLFKHGYDECLSAEAREVFERYKDYKAAKRLWKRQQKAADTSVDTFTTPIKALFVPTRLTDAEIRKLTE